MVRGRAVSSTAKSLEKGVRVLPAGFESKKTTLDLMTLSRASACMLMAFCWVMANIRTARPKAKMT